MARNSKKKPSNPRVNFEGVETISVVPEGEYITRVGAVKLEESQNGNDYLAWDLFITGGKNKGKKLFHNTSLAEQSLWATKKFLENLGVEVEDGEMELDLAEYVDMEVGVVVEHETYKGRTRSRVVDTFPAEDEGSEKGEDEGEGKTYTEDQINEMGKKELKELSEEHELEVELDGSTASQRRAMIKALKKADLISDGEEDEKPAKGKKSKVADEEDDEKPAKGRKDEDEEDEKPKSRRGRKAKDEDEEDEKPKKDKKSKKSKTYSADEINSMDEEALGEVIETHELDVDLDDHSTMKRKRSAVIDALEGAELLEE